MKKILSIALVVSSFLINSALAADPTFKVLSVTKSLDDLGQVISILVEVECTKDGITKSSKGFLSAWELSNVATDEAGMIKKTSERVAAHAQKTAEKAKEEKYSQIQLDAISIDTAKVAIIKDML